MATSQLHPLLMIAHRMKPVYLYLFTAIAMSLGWRIRGQFGHEIGAAMAGALAGLALVIATGRSDWHRRAVLFAGLAALGWSFGGSMSYMKVVGYCHSSDPATVLYGFVCLFLVGLLWAMPGGAAIAMAACWDAGKLKSTVQSAGTVFIVWFVQDIFVDVLESRSINTDWFGSDWLAASTSLMAGLSIAFLRKKVTVGVSLILHLSLGWWVGFAGLVVLAGLHMNPPRGDNWAGCLGLVVGLMIFLWRNRYYDVLRVSLVTGLMGAVGFCFAQLLKLSILRLQWLNDPHPVMEWLHGGFFGMAIVAAMQPIARCISNRSNEPVPWGVQTMTLFWLLWIIPYYNFRKCADQWAGLMPKLDEVFQGLYLVGKLVPSLGWIGWIEVIFLAWAVMLMALLVRQRSAPLALLSMNPRGRAVLLFVTLVAIFAATSFSRDLTNFQSGNELRIQVAITLHALACAMLALWPEQRLLDTSAQIPKRVAFSKLVFLGVMTWLLTAAMCVAGKEAMFHRTFAGGFYMDHIRFGPNNTNDQK
jgi:hypothetical protein